MRLPRRAGAVVVVGLHFEVALLLIYRGDDQGTALKEFGEIDGN